MLVSASRSADWGKSPAASACRSSARRGSTRRVLNTRSSSGTMAAISVWDSEDHAKQMDHLKEMVVTARGEVAALVGAYTGSIVNYPISWTI